MGHVLHTGVLSTSTSVGLPLSCGSPLRVPESAVAPAVVGHCLLCPAASAALEAQRPHLVCVPCVLLGYGLPNLVSPLAPLWFSLKCAQILL